MSLIESSPIRKTLEPTDMRTMNVGKRYWQVSIKKIDDSEDHKQAIQRYIENIRDNIVNGRGLLLHGKYSSGKTAASIIVAKAVVMHGGTALFVEIPELSDLKVTSRPFNDDMNFWERMESVDLLVLDDLGSDYQTDWSRQLVERIVRRRVNDCKAIVATTNKFAELRSIYDDGLVEVLSSCLMQVAIQGKDWRASEREDVRRAIMGDDES